jgi:hypothetical protein
VFRFLSEQLPSNSLTHIHKHTPLHTTRLTLTHSSSSFRILPFPFLSFHSHSIKSIGTLPHKACLSRTDHSAHYFLLSTTFIHVFAFFFLTSTLTLFSFTRFSTHSCHEEIRPLQLTRLTSKSSYLLVNGPFHLLFYFDFLTLDLKEAFFVFYLWPRWRFFFFFVLSLTNATACRPFFSHTYSLSPMVFSSDSKGLVLITTIAFNKQISIQQDLFYSERAHSINLSIHSLLTPLFPPLPLSSPFLDNNNTTALTLPISHHQ